MGGVRLKPNGFVTSPYVLPTFMVAWLSTRNGYSTLLNNQMLLMSMRVPPAFINILDNLADSVGNRGQPNDSKILLFQQLTASSTLIA
jgi:hypothetical protein